MDRKKKQHMKYWKSSIDLIWTARNNSDEEKKTTE